MKLEIISPEQTESFNVAWIEINTPTGNFVIQQGHAPTILILSPEKLLNFCLDSGKKESRMIKRGIIEIGRDKATLLVNKSV